MPFLITNVVVLKRVVIVRREAQRKDKAKASPSKSHVKQHLPKALLKMGITNYMIHHETMV